MVEGLGFGAEKRVPNAHARTKDLGRYQHEKLMLGNWEDCEAHLFGHIQIRC